MNIKEILNNFKNGDSTKRLGILSDIVTIFTAVITLITTQILTLKFVITDTTIIKIAFYIFAMGISLLLLYFYLKAVSYLLKEYKSFLVQSAAILMITSSLILLMVTIWSFVLTIS
ncbi:hypothetical protein [Cytobacillus firmus]|uniref:hypothetical protein n=1 Tax=Cytobacillus firmus TaxID=1399 RepID=UPI0034A50684